MVEYDRTQDREYAQQARPKICVTGVGSAGLNVLDRICMDRMVEASLVALHTDIRVLTHAMASAKVQLGAEFMRGIGAGGDPELGREAARISRDQIKEAIQGHEVIFICCGLGGGTASGAATVIAEVAKENNAMVLVFATMPFTFEGRRRLRQAETALAELSQLSDALVLFENNRMGELILPKEGIQKAFGLADQLIGHSVRAIATMVTQPGLVGVSLGELMSALSSPNSRCLFGFGEGRGSNRVSDALKRALKSPLLNQGLLLQNARNLLVHVAGSETLTLAEVESLMKQLGKYVPDETQILFGVAMDPKLGDMLTVTLISSLAVQQMVLEPSMATAPAVDRITARESRKPQVALAPTPEPQPQPVAAHGNGNGNGNGRHAPTPAPAPALAAELESEIMSQDPEPEVPVAEVTAAAAPAAGSPVMAIGDLFCEPAPSPSRIRIPLPTTAASPAAARVAPAPQAPVVAPVSLPVAEAPAAPVIQKAPAPVIHQAPAPVIQQAPPPVVAAPQPAPALVLAPTIPAARPAVHQIPAPSFTKAPVEPPLPHWSTMEVELPAIAAEVAQTPAPAPAPLVVPERAQTPAPAPAPLVVPERAAPAMAPIAAEVSTPVAQAVAAPTAESVPAMEKSILWSEGPRPRHPDSPFNEKNQSLLQSPVIPQRPAPRPQPAPQLQAPPLTPPARQQPPQRPVTGTVLGQILREDAPPVYQTKKKSIFVEIPEDEAEEPTRPAPVNHAPFSPKIVPPPRELETATTTTRDTTTSRPRSVGAAPATVTGPAPLAAARPAEPVPVGAGAGKGSPNGYQQTSLDLNQPDTGRFKGAEQTIVDGENLDIPTWARMRSKKK